MTAFVPSRYQQAIYREIETGTGDIIVNAVAGSGKTSTLQEAVNRLDFYVQRRTLLTAFNKHIQEELKRRQDSGKLAKGVKVSTLHGLGYGVLRSHFQPTDAGKWVDEYKYERLIRAYWDNLGLDDEALKSPTIIMARDATAQLANMAMLTLTDPTPANLIALTEEYGIALPVGKEPVIYKSIPQILKWGMNGLSYPDYSGKTYHPKESISFSDMVYLPVALDLPVPKYDLLFVDEAQDLSRVQQELLFKARSRRGRAVWVGDRAQAIYAFCGSDARSFDRIQETTNAKPLPLSICYRCPRAVVQLAQRFVPEIECAPDAIEGEVFRSSEQRLIDYVFAHAQGRDRSRPFMLLCRVNAPLIQVALQLLSRGVPCHIRGRDIGQGMAKLIDHLAGLPGFVFSEFPSYAEDYRDEQLAILRQHRKGQDAQINLNDRVDSVLAVYMASVSAGRRGVEEMKAFIKEFFSDREEAITLSSIHKAKGLEADKVGILRPDLLPHPKADTPAQLEQEANLCYVAITRAKQELYIAGQFGFEIQAAEEAAIERLEREEVAA